MGKPDPRALQDTIRQLRQEIRQLQSQVRLSEILVKQVSKMVFDSQICADS